jgi:cell division protein FtsL
MIKKLLFVAVTAAVVLSVAIAASNHYQHQQNKEKAQVQSQVDQANQKLTDLENRVNESSNSFNAHIEKLRAECLKGKAAYAKTTFAQKTGLQAPNCEL